MKLKSPLLLGPSMSHCKISIVLFLFLFLFFIYLFLAELVLCCCAQAFSSCGERCTSFSLWWLLLLWSIGSRCMGLVAPWHVGSSRTRARTRVPCIGRRILNHCATTEAPHCFAFTDSTHPGSQYSLGEHLSHSHPPSISLGWG